MEAMASTVHSPDPLDRRDQDSLVLLGVLQILEHRDQRAHRLQAWLGQQGNKGFLKLVREAEPVSRELREIPSLAAQDPRDSEDYRKIWGRLGRSELSVSRVLLVFLEFLARLDRPVHKVAWVLLGGLGP